MSEPAEFMLARTVDDRARSHALRVEAALPVGVLSAAGALHDVVEDGLATLAEVAERFGVEVATVVELVTRRPGEVYADFVRRAAADPRSRAVKLADVRDNLRDLPDGSTLRGRYLRALSFLE